MTVQELIDKLSELPSETKALPICAEDGMDPSDPGHIENVTVRHGPLNSASPAIEGDYVYLSP